MPIVKYIAVHLTPMKAIEYVINGEKTDEYRLVTGINISTDPKEAYEQFKMNFEMYSGERFYKKSAKQADEIKHTQEKKGRKKERVRLHHYIQSFAIGEVTPEQANEIGKRWAKETFAERAWKGSNYQILVCTHKDREHIHNHVLVSAYDLNGVIWRGNKATLKKAREISDSVSKEYGLSVISNPKKRTTKPYTEYLAEKNNKSWKVKMQFDIDRLILLPDVNSLDDLKRRLNEIGYETSGDKYLHIKRSCDKKKKPMAAMKLGDGYATEELLYRIKNKNVIMSLDDCNKYKYELTKFAFYLRQMQYYTYRKVKTDVEATYRQVRKISELLLFMSENNINFPSGLEYETNKADEKYRELIAKKADEKDIVEAKKRRDTLAECYTTYLECTKTDYDRIREEALEYYKFTYDSIELETEGVPLEINYFAEVSKESVTPQTKIDNDRWYHFYDDPDEVVTRDSNYIYYDTEEYEH